MVHWLNRIAMSDEVAQLAYEGKNDSDVNFTYINTKTSKEYTHRTTLYNAVLLAESRRNDKRYKNFEFYIG